MTTILIIVGIVVCACAIGAAIHAFFLNEQ